MAILNIKDFPDDLHRRVKSEAALRGLSIKAFIIMVLEEHLQRTRKGA